MKVRTKTAEEIKEIGNDKVGLVSCMLPYCNKEIEVTLDDGVFYQEEIDCYWHKDWLILPVVNKLDLDESYTLESLLSVIHGDGGQYLDKHGMAKAYADAVEKLGRWGNE